MPRELRHSATGPRIHLTTTVRVAVRLSRHPAATAPPSPAADAAAAVADKEARLAEATSYVTAMQAAGQALEVQLGCVQGALAAEQQDHAATRASLASELERLSAEQSRMKQESTSTVAAVSRALAASLAEVESLACTTIERAKAEMADFEAPSSDTVDELGRSRGSQVAPYTSSTSPLY